MRYCFLLLQSIISILAFSQRELKGIIADSSTRHILPFATIRAGNSSMITGINGHFTITAAAPSTVRVSYVGYRERTFTAGEWKDNDTLFLSPSGNVLGEVIVRPQDDRIRRIVNTAIRNKPSHNPEQYDVYQCNIYYKMRVDLLLNPMSAADSARYLRRRANSDSTKVDTAGFSLFRGKSHLLLSETFSKRLYKRPQQLQEIVIASRFSGLKKTYFINQVTDVLPFHIYSDYIKLNGRDYVNPIAKGWQQRYQFRLYDEIDNGTDTTFVLSFAPKEKTSFNSLTGLVYINSDGYAISHFIGNSDDTVSQRNFRIEQIYRKVNGRWFPRELNYDLVFKKYPSPQLRMEMNGHSIIDSVNYRAMGDIRIDKAYPVKLSDSVDLYTESQWNKLRMDSITVKERNTYRIIDSLSQKAKLEKIIYAAGKLAIGRLPLGKVDVDISRILASNDFEKTRLGIGLYTNDKVSKYYSIGGWFGYGFRDKVMKYGASATIYPTGNKDNWLRFSYDKTYQNAGNVYLHTDIDRGGFRNWILARVDKIHEYALTTHMQKGYWEIEVKGMAQKLDALYDNTFDYHGVNLRSFDRVEASVGLRYAYGEIRTPLFGYYVPVGSKYPIFYLRGAAGRVKADGYSNDYLRVLGGISYSKRLNRWGRDDLRLEAGLLHSLNDKPFSPSFLMASKGFRTDGTNWYAWGGFITMRPYDFYNDGYVSFLYKHDFDKYFWRLKFSKPYPSVAHNMMYGRLRNFTKAANAGIESPVSGYHESGILLNQLLQMNFFNAAYIYLNVGGFYHWTDKFDWKKNGVFVIGLSAGF
jgi:hypothetical protein